MSKPAVELNERWAALAVMRDRWRRGFCLPNYTPAGWWECDVFELTAAGYFREYEIKLTRSDFLADRAKEKRLLWGLRVESKHQLLAQRSPRGPCRFWYVTPPGLVERAELPEWAGLIELADRGEGQRPKWRWDARAVVEAPTLHRQPCDEKIIRHARGVCYYRMHGLLAGV
jgi:hypothetical protein